MLYFHFHVTNIQPSDTARPQITELALTAKLAAHAVFVGAAVFSSIYLQDSDSFKGVLTPTATLEWLTCLCVFAEFTYFSVTAFSTIGFGDIHPYTPLSRTLVIFFEIISLSYVLFLLNVLFGERELSANDGD